jgi:hypothetical protein
MGGTIFSKGKNKHTNFSKKTKKPYIAVRLSVELTRVSSNRILEDLRKIQFS